MGWVDARLAAAQNAAAALVTHAYWSANGTDVSSAVAPTAITLKSATVDNPSIVANNGPVESAPATAGVTITHYAFGHDSEGFVADTEWLELDEPVVLEEGGKIAIADGALTQAGHRTSGPPA